MLTDRAESMAEQLQAHRQEFPGTGSAATSRTRANSWLPEFAHAVLLVTGVGFALFTAFAWRSGLSNLPALKLYLLLPLLGGLLALARLTTAQLRRPGRETVTYLLFGLALLSWGLSGFWHVFVASQARGVVAFPSLGDFGYVGGEPQVLFTLAYLVLALGVTSCRLPAAPSIPREDDPRKKASSPYGGHPVP